MITIKAQGATSENAPAEKELLIGCGLLGFFHRAASLADCSALSPRLAFIAADRVICLCSKHCESLYWRWSGFDVDRSPDIVFEYAEFVTNVLARVHHRKMPLAKPICETLMMQSLFNGVGNYLRCEVLHRLKIAPFTPTTEVFGGVARLLETKCASLRLSGVLGDTPTKIRSLIRAFVEGNLSSIEKACPLLPAVRDIAEEAFCVSDDPTLFSDWLRCYEKAPNALNDSNGRKIWFYGDSGKIGANLASTSQEGSQPRDGDMVPFAFQNALSSLTTTPVKAVRQKK